MLPRHIFLVAVTLLVCSTIAAAGLLGKSHVTRTITTTSTAHSVLAQGRRVIKKGTGDRTDFYFTTNAWPRFRATYYQKDGNTLNYFKYRVGLAGITEFVGSDWSRANVVSEIRLAGRLPTEWTTMALTSLTGDDGTTIPAYTSSISGLAHQSGATVTLTAKWAPTYTTMADGTPGAQIVEYAANEIKFDVRIDGYNFTTPNSRLALITVVQSIADRNIAIGNGTIAALNIGGGGQFQWFSQAWHTFRNGTGDYVPMTNALLPDSPTEYSAAGQVDTDADPSETTNIFVYTLTAAGATPASVNWDPALGVAEQSGAFRRASAVFFTVVASIFVALL